MSSDDDRDVICGVILLYGYARPKVRVGDLYRNWHQDPVLQEYKRPPLDELLRIVKEVKTEGKK